MTKKTKIVASVYESLETPGEFVTVHRTDAYPEGTFVPYSHGVYASDEPTHQTNITNFCRSYVCVFGNA
jgi:hypothetical protein